MFYDVFSAFLSLCVASTWWNMEWIFEYSFQHNRDTSFSISMLSENATTAHKHARKQQSKSAEMNQISNSNVRSLPHQQSHFNAFCGEFFSNVIRNVGAWQRIKHVNQTLSVCALECCACTHRFHEMSRFALALSLSIGFAILFIYRHHDGPSC